MKKKEENGEEIQGGDAEIADGNKEPTPYWCSVLPSEKKRPNHCLSNLTRGECGSCKLVLCTCISELLTD